MNYEWFIARRYLQASRKAGFVSFITGFAVLGITIGTAAVIVALSIINGFEKEIKEKVFSFVSHVQVVGFQNQPLFDYGNSIQKVKQEIPGVRAVSPFVAKEAMIRAQDKVDGIFLKGIDPSVDSERLRQYMVKGRVFSSADGQTEVVLGKKLAQKLGIDTGGRVFVFGLPRRGSAQGVPLQPRAMAAVVSGVFESGMSEYDDIYVYTALSDAQKLFQLGDGISGFDIVLDDANAAPDDAQQIQRLLGYPHYARTAAQMYRNLFAWIELQKKPAPIFLGLIIVVATVNIIGALLMFVLEKSHGIGVLKAIGAAPADIRNIFLLQGLSIGLAGVLSGNMLAYGLCWVQLSFKPFALPSDIYFMSVVPILMRPEHFVAVSAIVLTLCLAAAMIPSRAAARLETLTILRFS